jgi:hypothetical protein
MQIIGACTRITREHGESLGLRAKGAPEAFADALHVLGVTCFYSSAVLR